MRVRDGEVKFSPRVRGDIRGLAGEPMNARNLHEELHRGNGRSVVLGSPNGPVKYINPRHPWLSTK